MEANHCRRHRQERRTPRIEIFGSGTLAKLERIPPPEPRRDKDALCETLGQRLMARDFDRQVAEVQVRVAVLNGYTALGIPVTKAVGQIRLGKGENHSSADLRNKAEPTLRRRLNRLAEGGLILWKLSPSWKRYQVKDRDNLGRLACGIDLSPHFQIANDVQDIAADWHRTEICAKALKSVIRDRRYTHAGLFTDGLVDPAKRALRRKLSGDPLQAILQQIDTAIAELSAVHAARKADETAKDCLGDYGFGPGRSVAWLRHSIELRVRKPNSTHWQ